MEEIKIQWRSKSGFAYRHFLTKVCEMEIEKHNVSHCHPQCEIYYLVSGRVVFSVDDRKVNLNVGDVLVVQGQYYHTIEVDPNYDYERCVIEVNQESMPSLSGISPLKTGFMESMHFIHIKKEIVDKTSILERFKELEKECLKEKYQYQSHIVLSHIIQIASEVALTHEKSNSLDNCKEDFDKNQEIIDKAIEYINENLGKQLDVDTLSKAVFLSRSYFQHQFKKYTKLSVTEYVLRQRMNTAKYMLSTGCSLSEVSKALGYKYYSLFCSHYKKYFGVPPKRH